MNKSQKAFEAYEKDRPPVMKSKTENARFADIGVVRVAFSIADGQFESAVRGAGATTDYTKYRLMLQK